MSWGLTQVSTWGKANDVSNLSWFDHRIDLIHRIFSLRDVRGKGGYREREKQEDWSRLCVAILIDSGWGQRKNIFISFKESWHTASTSVNDIDWGKTCRRRIVIQFNILTSFDEQRFWAPFRSLAVLFWEEQGTVCRHRNSTLRWISKSSWMTDEGTP